MIKLIYCINRVPNLSVEEFQEYWFNTHGPIAGAIKGVRRYLQCHTLPESYADDQQPPFDGCAQLWWDNAEAMAADRGSPEVAAALEDEKKFIDHSRVAMFVVREHEIVGKGTSGIGLAKMIVCTRGRPDFEGDVADYWLNTHAPIVSKLPGLRKYTVCLAEPAAERPFDGAAELYFDDIASANTAFASPEGREAGADTAKLFDTSALRIFYTREKVVVEGR
ncbi:MAG TPA: EthD family reductase [Dehalococcoidia bacterium]|nr:EthD family reductase [Dehalococcoidia bacterium]